MPALCPRVRRLLLYRVTVDVCDDLSARGLVCREELQLSIDMQPGYEANFKIAEFLAKPGVATLSQSLPQCLESESRT